MRQRALLGPYVILIKAYTMHGSQGNSGSPNCRLSWNWTAVILTVHAVIFLTLVGLAVGYPGASEWISQAVQAEFVTPTLAPTQLAQPAGQMQTARRY